MAKTVPDFGVSTGQLPAPDVDNAELAARVGSVSYLRRTGRVIYYDRFDSQALWTVNNASMDGNIAFIGYQCMALIPIIASTGSIKRTFPAIFSPRYGIEFCCAFNSGIDELTFTLNKFYPNNLLFGGVKLVFSSGNLQINNGSWVTVGTFNNNNTFAPGAVPIWNNIKLIIDFNAGLYSKVIFNEDEFLLTQSLNASAGGWSYNQLYLEIYALDTAGTAKAYIDNLILTIDEP